MNRKKCLLIFTYLVISLMIANTATIGSLTNNYKDAKKEKKVVKMNNKDKDKGKDKEKDKEKKNNKVKDENNKKYDNQKNKADKDRHKPEKNFDKENKGLNARLLIDECTVNSEKLNRQIKTLATQIKKKNVNPDDYHTIKESINELYTRQNNFINNLDTDKQKVIEKQVKVLKGTKKNIDKLLKQTDQDFSGISENDEAFNSKVMELNKEIDKLNRQYRAINWILYEN